MHGGGVGRAEDWFVRINRLNFAKILIQQGFAVSSYQSLNQWSPRGFRADRRNLEEVAAKMREHGAHGPAGEDSTRGFDLRGSGGQRLLSDGDWLISVCRRCSEIRMSASSAVTSCVLP